MVVSRHFLAGSPTSRKDPSRLPNVRSESRRVSATLFRRRKGSSSGGRYFIDGNEDPSIISPTPVILTYSLKGFRIVSSVTILPLNDAKETACENRYSIIIGSNLRELMFIYALVKGLTGL